jgi:hypothetical protein
MCELFEEQNFESAACSTMEIYDGFAFASTAYPSCLPSGNVNIGCHDC